jgi:hypothetical protein
MELKMANANQNATFHFVLGAGKPRAGIQTSDLVDHRASHAVPLPSLVVGPQMRQRGDRPVRWAHVIPPKLDNRPDFAGEKIVRGSIIKESSAGVERDMLVAYSDEGAHYVMVRTGLIAMEQNGHRSTANHLLDMVGKGITPVSHGSYSFDAGAIRIATADDINLLNNPNMVVGQVAAERIDAKAFGRKIEHLGCAQSSYVLWRMPFGAILLIRDVNGILCRIESQKGGLRHVDANGSNFGTFFDALEDAYRKARAV